MNHRHRILQMLSGQLRAVIEDSKPNWLQTDYAGDRLSPQEIGAARDEARAILGDFEALTKVRITSV